MNDDLNNNTQSNTSENNQILNQNFDNVEQLEIPEEEIKSPRKNIFFKILLIILVILVICFIMYVLYDKVLKNKIFSKEEQKTVEKKDSISQDELIPKEIFDNPSEPESVDATVLNKELTLKEICTNKTGICNKQIGEFKLGENKHILKVYINMSDLNNEKLYEKLNNSELALKNSSESNAIIVDSKRIPIGVNSEFDKIVKLNDNYFAIGVDKNVNNRYEIRIYNNDLNLVKIYSSIHVQKENARDKKMLENYSEYFKVENNAFTRYSCDISNDNGDGSNQMLDKYRVVISNESFNEIKVSSIKEYCSAQN